MVSGNSKHTYAIRYHKIWLKNAIKCSFLKSNFRIQFYKVWQFRPHNQCSHTYKVMHWAWLTWPYCFTVGGGRGGGLWIHNLLKKKKWKINKSNVSFQGWCWRKQLHRGDLLSPSYSLIIMINNDDDPIPSRFDAALVDYWPSYLYQYNGDGDGDHKEWWRLL